MIAIRKLREKLFPDHPWEPCDTYRKHRLIDGTKDTGSLMRRRVNGRRQYRAMTDREFIDWMCVKAW